MQIEENYFIDVDLTDNERKSVIMVYKQCGSAVRMVNSFTGKEAVEFFEVLCGSKKMTCLSESENCNY